MGIHRTTGLLRTALIAATIAAALTGRSAAAEVALRFTLDSKFEGPAAPFLLAIDRGYYKAGGLVVTVDAAADTTEAINRVAAGTYDLGIADINFLIKYRDQSQAAPIKAVFMVYNKPPYAIVGRKSRGVNQPRDLLNKKVGAPAADIAVAQWKLFAKVNDIDATKVTLENVGFPVREPLLQNGQVDAVIGLSYTILPNLKFMRVPADDIVPLLMADHGLDLYGAAIIVNPKFAAEKPEVVKAFLHAYVRSLKESARNPALAVDAVLKRNDTANKEVEIERLRITLRENVLTPEVKIVGYGGIDYGRLDKAIDQLAQTYEFKTKPKASDIFDASFLPNAASRRTH